MRIVVTYGSARGGTQGLAEMVADDLRAEGFDVDLLPPGQVWRLDGYDAVVVGGALYAARWHRAARRFVKRHAAEIQQRPAFDQGQLAAMRLVAAAVRCRGGSHGPSLPIYEAHEPSVWPLRGTAAESNGPTRPANDRFHRSR
jgi:hypothetical protein